MQTSARSYTRPLMAACAIAMLALATAQAAEKSTDVRMSPSTVDPANRVPPGMCFIPAGDATIGLDEKEIQALKEENPAFLKVLDGSVPKHRMTIEGFYLDTREVTNREWKHYLDAVGLEPSEDQVKYSWVDGKIPEGQENMPAVCVSHAEARAYARWARKRLPTEFEWEYAARGAEGRLYPWGDEFVSANAHFSAPKVALVGEKGEGKSPFGLLDMAGNVWEWTDSAYLPYPKNKPIKISTKFSRGRKDEYSAAEFYKSTLRVIRGGAWDSRKVALLSAVRQFAPPKTWNNTLGFRCARSARPGLDALTYATKEAGAFRFADYQIDVESLLSFEVTDYDESGLITGNRHFLFAPVGNWDSLKKMQTASRTDPQPLGVLSTTEDMVLPKVQPGTYLVAYWAASKRTNGKNGKKVMYPTEGWHFNGWEAFDPNLEARKAAAERDAQRDARKKAKADRRKKSSRKKKGTEEEEKAEGEKTEGEAKEGEPQSEEEELKYKASQDSVPYDITKDNILLINQFGTVIASYAVEQLKDSVKHGPARLERQMVGEDKRRKLPRTERYAISFTVPLPSRKAVAFELPLRLLPDLFKAETRTAKDEEVVDEGSDSKR